MRSSEGERETRVRRFSLAVIALLLLAGLLYWLSSAPDSSKRENLTSPANQQALLQNEDVPDELPADFTDPRRDGWDSEVFGDQVTAQFKHLSHLIESVGSKGATAEDVDLSDRLFSCVSLRPADLVEVRSDGRFTVLRSPSRKGEAPHTQKSLTEAVRELVSPFDGAGDVRVKFKLFRISVEESDATTIAYYQAAGRFKSGAVQQSATWRCRWTGLNEETPPRLSSIGVIDYEEVVNHSESGVWFSDCTESIFARNESWGQELAHGLDHWRKRLPVSTGIEFTGHHGLAIGDVNGDGLEDIYLCRPGGLPNRLYVQKADGTVQDVSSDAGVDWLDTSRSALLVDLDNDGDEDLVTTVGWGVIVQSNDGAGRFTRQVSLPVLASTTSLAAADYDLDGDLDLYVCANESPSGDLPIPLHDANNGGGNLLFRNEGDWKFTDVTVATGMDENNRRFSFAAAWEDYDQDGDPDLYVANDYGRNNLYRNDGGKFHDVAAELGIEDLAAGMSVTWGDYNSDGRLDLYVSNMFSSAGNRIAYQRRFKADVDEKVRAQFQRHARGNSLFENIGDGSFRDVSTAAHVTMGRWAWGSNFCDIDNDGLDDLFVANGYASQEDTGDL